MCAVAVEHSGLAGSILTNLQTKSRPHEEVKVIVRVGAGCRIGGNRLSNTRTDVHVVGAAPESLNTLKEISDALADDDNQMAALVNSIAQKLNTSDIVDNLTSTAVNNPLSAKQGKILNDLISSLYTKSEIDSLLSASGGSPSYPCSVFSTENMNFTSGSSSFKVVSENALSWVVQLTLDVEFSSVSDYSSGIVFSYDSALLPNSYYSECLRTDSLARIS